MIYFLPKSKDSIHVVDLRVNSAPVVINSFSSMVKCLRAVSIISPQVINTSLSLNELFQYYYPKG